jgi:hypothetical protein
MRKTIVAVSAAAALAIPAGALAQAPPPADLAPTCGQSTTSTLWPPNHKYKNVALPTATDPEGMALTATAPSVTQDEPVDAAGTGDGHTSPDARVTPSGGVQVRSERNGTGNGRFYAVSVTFTDPAGNAVTCTNFVVVPHDKGRKHKPVNDGTTFNSFG